MISGDWFVTEARESNENGSIRKEQGGRGGNPTWLVTVLLLFQGFYLGGTGGVS